MSSNKQLFECFYFLEFCSTIDHFIKQIVSCSRSTKMKTIIRLFKPFQRLLLVMISNLSFPCILHATLILYQLRRCCFTLFSPLHHWESLHPESLGQHKSNTDNISSSWKNAGTFGLLQLAYKQPCPSASHFLHCNHQPVADAKLSFVSPRCFPLQCCTPSNQRPAPPKQVLEFTDPPRWKLHFLLEPHIEFFWVSKQSSQNWSNPNSHLGRTKPKHLALSVCLCVDGTKPGNTILFIFDCHPNQGVADFYPKASDKLFNGPSDTSYNKPRTGIGWTKRRWELKRAAQRQRNRPKPENVEGSHANWKLNGMRNVWEMRTAHVRRFKVRMRKFGWVHRGVRARLEGLELPDGKRLKWNLVKEKKSLRFCSCSFWLAGHTRSSKTSISEWHVKQPSRLGVSLHKTQEVDFQRNFNSNFARPVGRYCIFLFQNLLYLIP